MLGAGRGRVRTGAWGALIVALLAARAAPAAADPCRQDTSVRARAEERLRGLGRRIEALGDAAPIGELVRELETLLGEPCFGASRAGRARLPPLDSALALRDWWQRGGADWLSTGLERSEDDPDAAQRLMIPPDARPTLTLDTAPNSPIAPLLCPLAESGCGIETSGFLVRAERHLHDPTAEPPHRDRAVAACAAAARKQPADRRSAAFRGCVEPLRGSYSALPLVRLRLPKSGWLVLRGRRGHYQYCDELRAYELATGSAWIVKSCDRLFHFETPPQPGGGIVVETGRLTTEHLREAAWFLMIAPFITPAFHPFSDRYTLPADLPLRPLDPRAPAPEAPRVIVTSSGQTEIAWTWAQAGAALASGHFTWDGMAAPSRYAMQLVEVVEAGLRPGCAPTAPPVPLPGGDAVGGVSTVDAAPARLVATGDRLLRALREEASARRCPGVPQVAPDPPSAGHRPRP
jgi:hypothetical protein